MKDCSFIQRKCGTIVDNAVGGCKSNEGNDILGFKSFI